MRVTCARLWAKTNTCEARSDECAPLSLKLTAIHASVWAAETKRGRAVLRRDRRLVGSGRRTKCCPNLNQGLTPCHASKVLLNATDSSRMSRTVGEPSRSKVRRGLRRHCRLFSRRRWLGRLAVSERSCLMTSPPTFSRSPQAADEDTCMGRVGQRDNRWPWSHWKIPSQFARSTPFVLPCKPLHTLMHSATTGLDPIQPGPVPSLSEHPEAAIA